MKQGLQFNPWTCTSNPHVVTPINRRKLSMRLSPSYLKCSPKREEYAFQYELKFWRVFD
jgi:hypothetical protein